MGPRNLGWPVDRGLGTQYLRGPLIDHPERRPREADWLHCLKNFYAYCACTCARVHVLIHSRSKELFRILPPLGDTRSSIRERDPLPHPRPFYLSKKECNSSGGSGGSSSFVENVLAWKEKRRGWRFYSQVLISLHIAKVAVV